MGIYDRDYYRREGPSFLATFSSGGQVCKYLILANIGFFLLQILAPRDPVTHQDLVTEWLALKPSAVFHGQIWRLLTHAFLHDQGTWTHIVFNMLFLWWFGHEVETIYGPREFLAFYLISAIFAGLAYTLTASLPINARGPEPVALGASGAVTAVLLVCACHYPTKTILLFFFLPVPIWVFIAVQVGQDLFHVMQQLKGETVLIAASAHLGGALFGYLYYKYNWRVTNWLPELRKWNRDRKARSRFKIFHDSEERVRTPVTVGATSSRGDNDLDEQLEAKLDAVLKKVSESGKESLSESEQKILLRASEIYKKRRS